MNVIEWSIRDEKSEVQNRVTKLEERKYVHFTSTKCEAITVQNKFWAHPKSIKFLNSFSTILIMNSTYKNNLYIILLFEIIGVTSIEKTNFGYQNLKGLDRKRNLQERKFPRRN